MYADQTGPGNTDKWSVGRWRFIAWGAGVLLVLLPLIAMQFTDEVAWSLADFVMVGGLVLGVGVAFEMAVRRTANPVYRAAVGIALAAAFLLVWVNGAIGLIGAESNAANLMYYGVLAVGLAGAFAARFEPRGMARAMGATVLALGLVAVIMLVYGLGEPTEVVLVNGLFALLFAGSALLFLRVPVQRGGGGESA